MLEYLESAIRLATPLIFAALGGLLCERSGIATICLEGVMLMAAWAAATITFTTHDPMLGLIVGMGMGSAMISIHAFLTNQIKTDAIISGIAVNLLAMGITPILTKSLFESATSTPSIPTEFRLDGYWLVGLAIAIAVALHWILYKTGWGLRVQAAGDNAQALETAGVRPAKVRWAAMLLGGAICGLGGVYLSISHASQFTRGMTAGRGYIALTALIFGRWKPLPTLAAAFFFGMAEAAQILLQGSEWLSATLPIQAIHCLPYLITLIVLAITSAGLRGSGASRSV